MCACTHGPIAMVRYSDPPRYSVKYSDPRSVPKY